MRHALAGNDMLGAVQLVAQHRHHLLDTDQRPHLEHWLRVFPATTLVQHAELLLSKAWIGELNRSDSQTGLDLVDQSQACLKGGPSYDTLR